MTSRNPSMGPVLVTTMVQPGVGDASSKKVHPFFARSADVGSCSDKETATSVSIIGKDSVESAEESLPRQKRRKTTFDNTETPESETKSQHHEGSVSAGARGTILELFNKPAAVKGLTDPFQGDEPLSSDEPATLKPDAATPKSSQLLSERVEEPLITRKVMKLNTRTGTLGSPPKPKKQPKPTQIVTMKFGIDDESRKRIGDRILRILDGLEPFPVTPTKRGRPRKSLKTGDENPNPKVPHPLFVKKAPTSNEPFKQPQHATRPPRERHSIFMSTPVSPQRSRDPCPNMKMHQFGMKSTGVKVPGAMHPLWPAQGMSHVRGDEHMTTARPLDTNDRSSKKCKGQTVTVSAAESVLAYLAYNTNFAAIRDSLPKNNDTFLPPPTELRLPQRHFESGHRLRQRLRRELRSPVSLRRSTDGDSSPDELAQEPLERPHPVIRSLWESLETRLSAFDRSTCETLPWTSKYAPTSTVQVVQSGKEMSLLKQWLEGLRVQAVEGGVRDPESKPKSKSETAPKKKRRKNKLDGFVVDSDEEVSDMDEVLDNDESMVALPGSGRKTMVRSSALSAKASTDQGRLANAIVISGPHGCGKTAAVYAVAKELGFEVFEINSSSRRSGKDVLERVGDMTRNHLVQQHHAEVDSNKLESADTLEDIKAGKQGTMTSFFKLKGKSGKKQDATSIKEEPKSKMSAPRAQKQSLILLEEVDILYEEDKQFWTSLMSMMTQSKRPFVLTCNDESLIPIQALNLHGIFRFVPPPEQLAVDLCLLIAANEGHALKRGAINALFHSRNCDLRATITDLNYWCQLGVGDRRGGFDWFYLRWPKGVDRDVNGDVVRVVSEDTYRKGMGWVGRDAIVTTRSDLEQELESKSQVWNFWNRDLCDLSSSSELFEWTSRVTHQQGATNVTREVLDKFEAYCSAVSDADLCSDGAFADMLRENLDPSLPDMTASAKDDYIIGRTLLDAEAFNYSSGVSQCIADTLQLLAQSSLRHFDADSNSSGALVPVPRSLEEDQCIRTLDASFRLRTSYLTRYDLAVAFDPIAVSPKAVPSTHLDPSVFDRTLKLIVVDVAPWVRNIVAYDHQLAQDRLRLSDLLSEGGKTKKKRMRTTRSAYSALEGGERRTTRRERYFADALDTATVMKTGGLSWQDAVESRERGRGSDLSDMTPSSPMSVDSAV